MWFEELTGFSESDPEQVRRNFILDGSRITSLANGRTMDCGKLEISSLGELQAAFRHADVPTGEISVSEVVANVQHLLCDEDNRNAVFQVASQFNLLEMVSPGVTPEAGVGIYEEDLTQGPACAIACGAGTIFRNYFMDVCGKPGQSESRQVDCLSDLGAQLGNDGGKLWRMQNGYALPTREGLEAVASRLQAADDAQLQAWRRLLKVGCQWDTEVTLPGTGHTVSQIYCSALPVRYTSMPDDLWSEFAQLVLDAAYEATFCAAALALARTGSNKLFLTLLGGGAFGNREKWILSALERSLSLFSDVPLSVSIVSFGDSNVSLKSLISHFG